MFHWPSNNDTYSQDINSFLVGDALLVSPKLTGGNESYEAYFPTGTWVSMQDYSDMVDVPPGEAQGEMMKLSGTTPTVNVHLRPGRMVPFQKNVDGKYNSTQDMLKRAPLALVIN